MNIWPLPGLPNREGNISLVAFADDVFRELVWVGSGGAARVRRVLDESDQLLDEALKTGGWAGTEIQCELVLELRRQGLARSLHDGQLE